MVLIWHYVAGREVLPACHMLWPGVAVSLATERFQSMAARKTTLTVAAFLLSGTAPMA